MNTETHPVASPVQALTRTLIAQEVIRRVGEDLLRPTRGNYLIFAEASPHSQITLRELLLLEVEGKPQGCDCCAQAALLMGALLLQENPAMTWSWWMRADGPEDGLMDFFSRGQLVAIEKAFEGWAGRDGDPKDRMIAVMQNIVDNAGTFVEEGHED